MLRIDNVIKPWKESAALNTTPTSPLLVRKAVSFQKP